MELYTQKDVDLVVQNIDPIIDKIEKTKQKIYEPTYDQQMAAINVIMKFLKDKKRKIYGGYAQNALIVSKDKNDSFYPEGDIPDIDFYSPDPLQDVKDICDLLYDSGFKDKVIEGREAQHKETYKIFVNYGKESCDISYVPKNIYNRMPFIELNGIYYAHPSFMYIDLYRIMSEPYFSSRRWTKNITRLHLLQKHFPFKKYTTNLSNAYDVEKGKEKKVMEINKFLCNELKDKSTYIVTGQYAYNYYLSYVKMKYKYVECPLLQIVSTNYVQDATDLIKKMKKFDNMSFTEFYPFWQFTGYNVVIYYEDVPLVHMTSHNNKCIPTKVVPFKTFYGGNVVEDKKSTVQLGSFDYVFFMNLMSGFRCRVNDLGDKCGYHNIMTSHLIEFRNHYFKEHKKTLLDDTLFQSFIPDCIGTMPDPIREGLIERNTKYKSGKLVVYKYKPGTGMTVPDFKFANTSGNPVVKEINLKIAKNLDKDDIKINLRRDHDDSSS